MTHNPPFHIVGTEEGVCRVRDYAVVVADTPTRRRARLSARRAPSLSWRPQPYAYAGQQSRSHAGQGEHEDAGRRGEEPGKGPTHDQ
jgi:hypothetical protein